MLCPKVSNIGPSKLNNKKKLRGVRRIDEKTFKFDSEEEWMKEKRKEKKGNEKQLNVLMQYLNETNFSLLI